MHVWSALDKNNSLLPINTTSNGDTVQYDGVEEESYAFAYIQYGMQNKMFCFEVVIQMINQAEINNNLLSYLKECLHTCTSMCV